TQRVAYVHRNTPGVMALVNQAFAESGANVSGQILGTRGEIGYMISDLSNALPQEVVAALGGMEDTIRLRVI
ncbi:MAG: phosphoglycerate dehydrogenase, partial [Ruaniaceae bacterium]|nr:phosphoglycerate dehydrogenase [Ruaniaceae bacterium]